MQQQYSSRSCFLCGRQNPLGLKISWYSDTAEQKVKARIIIPRDFCSYPGFVHGGIVAAILDETAGRALMVNGDHDFLMVTATLEVKYRHPVPTETPLQATGWIVRPGKNRARVAAEITREEDGTVLASCQATVLRPPDEYYRLWNWEQEKPYWKVYED